MISYRKQWEKLKKDTTLHMRWLSQIKCARGEDCATCIYEVAKKAVGHERCSIDHKRHVSEEDMKRFGEKYKDNKWPR